LAGDFEPKRTKELIEKYYSQLETRALPARKYPVEPEAKAPQRKVMPWEVQAKSFLIAYKGVASSSPDEFALDLAAAVLGSGSSSRLYKKLVYEEQTATMATAMDMTGADPGSFMVMVSMKPGIQTEKAEEIVLNEIEKLKGQLISEKELQKAKNQVMMDYMEGLTTIDGKAQSLAINEIIFGDFQHLFSDLEKYNQVTVKDVQRVAQKYLKPEKRVTALLEPKGRP